jgi:adenylate cyclase
LTLTKYKKHWLGGGAGLLLAVVLGLVLGLGDLRERNPDLASKSPGLHRLLTLLEELKLGQALIHLSYDVPFRWRPTTQPQEVVLVYLDDASHEALGQPYNDSWDRGLYARLVDRLTAEGARAVAFDIVFSTPNTRNPQGDVEFARALKANGKTILAADYLPSQEGEGMTVFRAFDNLFDAAAGYGLSALAQDQDFIVRRHLHVPYEEGSDIHSSLSWQLAKTSGGSFAQDPRQRSQERWVNYYGPPGALAHVSFQTALETNTFCPPGCFSGRVVLIGGNVKSYFSGQRKDELRTPFTRLHEFVPAVDTQATLTLNLLRGDWLNRLPSTVELLILALVGVGFGFGLVFFRPLIASAIALAGALCVGLLATAVFHYGRLWFPWMIIVAAQIPAALLWSVAFNSVALYVQNRLYEQSLRMYLPAKLVRKFSSDKDLLKPGAQNETLTFVFTDIADFTSLSEGMDPDELAHLMNTYFQAAVGDCIHKTDGTVAKFLGDGIFAFWNAPDRQDDHAMRACEAGLRFLELNRRPIAGRELRTRIGIHTGLAHVGNFGSEDRVDYTALGENVNLASRLEGLNKFLGTQCLLSGWTKKDLGARFLTRPLGKFRLKGFEALVEVHELIGTPEEEPATRPWREAFEQALRNYEQQNLEFAGSGFRQVLEMRPDDGPSKFFLKQITERIQENLPSETWTSFTVLKEK